MLTFETMKILRALALPFSIIYGIITWVRNKLYDVGIFSSTEFSLPVISVGNLSVGGTGKSPHIEYLIRLLKGSYSVAALSRGYGRRSGGFLVISEEATTEDAGDEPLQFRKKFGDDVVVAVDSKRVRGIKKLLQMPQPPGVVLLDDAFQHRAVKPSLSILLTDFSNPYHKDSMLPTGTLREFSKGAKRADIIIVTKAPANLVPIEKRNIIKDLKPRPYQRVYFSYITYGDFIPAKKDGSRLPLSKEFYFERDYSIVLLTGIANPAPLEEYLKAKAKEVISVKFADHHEYSETDVTKLRKIFDNLAAENKIILTTEKDAMRLQRPGLEELLSTLPLFYIPIEIRFHDKDAEEFDKQILDHVRSNPNTRARAKAGSS